MKHHFLNLTNGIQAIQDYGLEDVRFIRIQSTACEQKRWEDILMTLSDDFLMSAVLGHECVVYDYGANKDVPRAVWQGLEWVKYVLSRRWHGEIYRPVGRAKACQNYFAVQYSGLSSRAKSRLDYFARYLNGPLRISAITGATDKDGKTEWYAGIVKGWTLAEAA